MPTPAPLPLQTRSMMPTSRSNTQLSSAFLSNLTTLFVGLVVFDIFHSPPAWNWCEKTKIDSRKFFVCNKQNAESLSRRANTRTSSSIIELNLHILNLWSEEVILAYGCPLFKHPRASGAHSYHLCILEPWKHYIVGKSLSSHCHFSFTVTVWGGTLPGWPL